MSKIDPTVGKTVWFNPAYNSTNSAFAPATVCAAIVAAVLPDGRVNLAVFDANGASHSMEKVPLVQDGEASPENGYYAEWIPEGGKPATAAKRPEGTKVEDKKTEETKAARLSSPAVEPSPFSTAADPVVSPPAEIPAEPKPTATASIPLAPAAKTVEGVPVSTTAQPVT
jgi:hypothetical protein